MKHFLALLFILQMAILGAHLPEPYASIKVLPEMPFGYYGNAAEFEAIFQQNPQIRVVVEVGSWIGGGSTRHLGQLLKQKQGTLYAVDTWLGSWNQQVGTQYYQPVLDYVYQQFLSNMIHWGLANTIIPCRMRSIEAARALQVKPDLIYIDGEHTEEAVYEDLTAWYPFVQRQGILCGDDWSWQTVRSAVQRFAAEKNLRIESTDSFWRLHFPNR